MDARLVSHPSADVLRALGSGQLDDAAAETVFLHLEACSECRAKVASLSGDGFLKRVRAAWDRRNTPVPGQPLPATIDYTKSNHPVPTTVQRPVDVPLELRDHQQYEVIRELGRGGMGVVYLAKNKLMSRLEVLKVVNPKLLDHPDVATRFLREICSAANLNHPNIVIAYSALQSGALLAFAMEYIEGADLARVVKGRGALPVANACYYVQQAALGLQHASDKGMVHRDIKPQNLILAQDGKKHVVKILDFGLAKATYEKAGASRTLLEANRKLTKLGTMMGTPEYIAPEQIMDAARADIRADIYSLGCTLYFLLTGKPPFQKNSLDELLQAHYGLAAAPLDQVRADVPAALAAVVARMMAKDPGKRYQTPVEVSQALAPFVKTGLKPIPAGPMPPSGTPHCAKPRGSGPQGANHAGFHAKCRDSNAWSSRDPDRGERYDCSRDQTRDREGCRIASACGSRDRDRGQLHDCQSPAERGRGRVTGVGDP
jgi:serine/threonine protein kinase